MHTNTAKYAHFTHQFLYGLVIDHKLFLQLFGNSPISVTPFAFLINAAYFSFDFSISIWLWMIKLLAVIVIGTAGNIGNLNEQSCLSSHITCAFSLAVPARQPRHSIFLSMHSPHEDAVLLQSDLLLS